MKAGGMIGQYRILQDFRVVGAGLSEWTFAEYEGREYFIKRFLSPTYPAQLVLLKTVAHSLKILHDHRIVHSDPKPSNALIKRTEMGLHDEADRLRPLLRRRPPAAARRDRRDDELLLPGARPLHPGLCRGHGSDDGVRHLRPRVDLHRVPDRGAATVHGRAPRAGHRGPQRRAAGGAAARPAAGGRRPREPDDGTRAVRPALGEPGARHPHGRPGGERADAGDGHRLCRGAYCTAGPVDAGGR